MPPKILKTDSAIIHYGAPSLTVKEAIENLENLSNDANNISKEPGTDQDYYRGIRDGVTWSIKRVKRIKGEPTKMIKAEDFYNQQICLSCQYYFYESCLRYPPEVRYQIGGSRCYGECPTVPPRHWCGEHKRVDLATIEERLSELERPQNDIL